MLRKIKRGRETNDCLPIGMPRSDFLVPLMLAGGMVSEGNHRHFLTDVHEQHPVVNSVHKAVQSPATEPPMGHTLPHAFTADGSFVFTLENAVSHLINQLYRGLPLPTSPQSQATPKQVKRNTEIRAKYEAGTSVPDLAKEYGISKKRVYQILRWKRK